MNQNSLFGLDLEKVFFAPGPKIVLQHYRPEAEVEILISVNFPVVQSSIAN